MATVLYSELIDRARAAADMHDEFVNTEQWLYFANSELNKLWVKLIRSGFPPAVDFTDITLTGATSYTITEPAAIIGIYEMQSAKKYFRLPIKPRWAQYNVTTGTHPREVYVYPTFATGLITLVPYPTPSAASLTDRKLVVITIPKPLKLVSGGASDGVSSLSTKLPFGWEERIVLGMAEAALAREETVNPIIQHRIAEVDEMISTHVHDYILRQANTVDDYNGGPNEYVNYAEWFYV